MALGSPLSSLVITLTQGSADAFVQGSVLTGLTGRQAYNLRGISWEQTGALPGIASGLQYDLSITRRSKAASATIADSDVIWKMKWEQRITTSGALSIPMSGYFAFPEEIEVPLVEETIYAQLDSTSTSTTTTFILRLDVDLDTMSDIDRLNLIARSLT